MKNKLYLISIFFFIAFVMKAQVVTSTPSPLNNDSENVVIYFHSDQGNKELQNAAPTTAIYAHTGVCVIDDKGNSADWKYAPAWLDNNPKYKLEYVSTNLWKLEIGNLRTYYGVNTNERITRLCFVFRDATGNLSGRAAGGGDIFLNVSGGEVSKPSPLTEVPAQGATRNPDGSVTFCVAAPQKEAVMVLGSWNDYLYTDSQLMEYIDEKDGDAVFRYFTVTLPAATIPVEKPFLYYYLVDNAVRVCDPYANLILDPYNDKYIPQSLFPNIPEYPAAKLGDVPLAWVNPSAGNYNWTVPSFKPADKSDLIIYELLIRDFTGTESQAVGNGTIRNAIEKIPYLKSLGINAVELLPITEFNGNNSWGYNPNFYFAPDKAYGTPADYKEFIDKCHSEGIAVILDMVFNQSDGLHPWYKMYDTDSNPFYNAVAPHAYSVLNDWDQGYPLVERQWKDALQYWLKEYRVDGFRFDLVKGLGNNDSYADASGAATDAYNQSRIDRMIRLHSYMKEVNPDAIFINEDLATYQEENAMAADGQLNWVNVNTEGRNYASGIQSDSGLNRMWANDNNRTPGSTVSYLESHDEERLGYAARNSSVIQVKGNKQIRIQRLSAAAAQMILVPGSHMIWQFSEMGNDQTTKNADWSNNTSPKYVNWNLLNDPLNLALMETYRDLIHIRLSNPQLFVSEATPVGFSMQCQSSNWASGRKITSVNGNLELYTVINPNITGTLTIPVSFKTSDNASYKIMVSSPNADCSFDALSGFVTVPANCFVTIGSQSVADVKGIADEETTNEFTIHIENHNLAISANCPISIYNAEGTISDSLPEGIHQIKLNPGIYILKGRNQFQKVFIR